LEAIAERRIRGLAAGIAAALGFLLLEASDASALEAFDGRIQAHGYYEMQLRAIDEHFDEQLDLSQWYNVLNLELEFDVLPNGWGPIDLLQAYVRAEARYDCVWTRGCGMFRSVNTYGDQAKRLPDRLTDGHSEDYTGVLPVGLRAADNPENRVQTLDGDRREDGSVILNRGAWGFSRFRNITGADDLPDTADDPFRYTMFQLLDYAFTSISHRGADGFGRYGSGGQKTVLGPWLPENFIDANAALRDVANPFRGRMTPTPGGGLDGFLRYHTADPLVNGIGTPTAEDLANPYFANPDEFPEELIQFLPPETTPGSGLVIPGTQTFGTFLLDNGAQVILTESTAGDFGRRGTNPFGGDYSGISGCVKPGTAVFDRQLEEGNQAGCIPFTNVRVTGGTGELPLRPAPDISNLVDDFDPRIAQGLYIPSQGLIRHFEDGDFDSLDMNYRESELAWNRGASQQDTKELKEAYLETALFDNRLWMRLGLQQIVWGKTELFRNTDQFNPQDLALSTIPSLEESRIGVLAARFIYSLYDVGPLEDVRLEFALNVDDMQPADLGVCGEPYAANSVCELSAATFSHGFLGVGVAGVDRPTNPWDDADGLEFGARIEWRWDRFSFALTDFYGYDDFPYLNSIMTYERNVDVLTGRPLITRFNPGNPRGNCLNALASGPKDQASVTPFGIGSDPDCLGFGTPLTSGGSSNNALEWHHANQQLFAWTCSVTIGFLEDLDQGSCFSTLFNQGERLSGFSITFTEIESVLLAGENQANNFFGVIALTLSDEGLGIPTPTRSINRDANDGFITAISGSLLDCVGSGGSIVGQDPGCNVLASNGGFNQGPIGGNVLGKQLPTGIDYFTLDSGLTNEQRALLGCGPFFGTRCDSAATFALNDCDPLMPGCTVFEASRNLFFDKVIPGTAQPGGGIDLLNLEASALLQSFPGFEGTPVGYITTSNEQAPGTIDFDGGPVCTRYVPGSNVPVTLPGCRGIDHYEITATQVIFTFDAGYDPRVDGCLLAPTIATHAVVTLDSNGNDITGSAAMMSCFGQLAPSTGDFDPSGPTPSTVRPCDNFADDAACQAEIAEYLDKRNSDSRLGDYLGAGLSTDFPYASTLYHPLAGCLTDAEIALQQELFPDDGPRCNFTPNIPGFLDTSPVPVPAPLPAGLGDPRNFDAEFLAGTAQIFQNELAAVSWNFAMFLVVSSACSDEDGRMTDPECFDSDHPWQLEKCSFNQPQYCSAIKDFFSLAGVQRNTVRAAGNDRFGRRTFLWHSGGEAVLKYDRRNILGFAMDFPEDRTKSNWGMEFTWFGSVPVYDADEFDSISQVDQFNLTISIDRPTFINFLNPNRTFFFNTQWFFQYVGGFTDGMGPNGPFSALFTFTVNTGYHQDRLNPALVTIYDFNSRSGGVMPSIQYRFTEAFSVAFGMGVFFGRTQLTDMPVNPLRPASNRVGNNAYRDPTEQFLSGIRHRDEVWMRLRWTF
jgi:hypothetical protein